MELVKRFAVTVAGGGLLLVGLAMMVLPGPGILLIVAGLALLATEYVWARALLKKARSQAEQVQEAAVSSPLRTAGSVVFAIGLVVVGVLMILVEDVAWPVLEGALDAVWGPVTGTVLIVTGLVLLATTYLTIRTAKGQDTTYTPDPKVRLSGASRYRPGATRYER